MFLVISLIALVSVAWYFIRVGKKLNQLDHAKEALDDVKDIYKMETTEDLATEERLASGKADPDSVASAFPKLRNPALRRRALQDLPKTSDTES